MAKPTTPALRRRRTLRNLVLLLLCPLALTVLWQFPYFTSDQALWALKKENFFESGRVLFRAGMACPHCCAFGGSLYCGAGMGAKTLFPVLRETIKKCAERQLCVLFALQPRTSYEKSVHFFVFRYALGQ